MRFFALVAVMTWLGSGCGGHDGPQEDPGVDQRSGASVQGCRGPGCRQVCRLPSNPYVGFSNNVHSQEECSAFCQQTCGHTLGFYSYSSYKNVITEGCSCSSCLPPFGHVDCVGCGSTPWTVTGWSLDLDEPSVSVVVHFYIDGAFAGYTVADQPRPDVNNVYGVGGQHGFVWSIPARFRTPGPHQLVAYGINTSPCGGNRKLGSDKSYTVP